MTTFPLSSGTDSVTGTAISDLITGKSTEWQAADTINGAAGNDTLQITAATAATAVVTDALFQKVSSVETLTLLGGFAETVTVAALSDAAGLVEIDGSGLTGALTVDAGARIGGIAIDASKGANTLLGSIDNDTFRFTSAGFTATDKVDGGGMGDTDTLQIIDKANVADAAFANVTHVEHLALGGGLMDYTGQKVTLGALSIKAGIVEVDVLDNQGATLDAGARASGISFHGNNGNDVFKASQGDDVFLGGAGSDSYQVKGAQFTGSDAIDGGADRDEIRIMDATTPIIDADFAQVKSVETLAFNATGKQSVTLGGAAALSGLDTIDATKVTGLDLNVSNAFTNMLTVTLGTGADTLHLGDGNQHTVKMKSTALTAADTIIGNAANKVDTLEFTDAVKLADKYFLNAVNVDNFGYLAFDNAAKGQSLVAGDNFKAFVANTNLQYVMATGAAKDTSFTFDFSQYTGNKLYVVGSGGSDVFTAGAIDNAFFGVNGPNDQGGADSFRFASAYLGAADIVYGGKSVADELVILDDKTAIIDSDFTNVAMVEHLRLNAVAGGSYDLTLGTKFDNSGITLVDAAKAGVNVTVNAAGATVGMTVLAGAKDNFLTGGAGDDVFQFATATLNGSDFVKGGTSVNGDTLQFTTGGTIGASALANVQGIEVYQLSDKGNSIALTDALVGTGEGVMKTFAGYTLLEEGFVLTGKGKDTVDLSQLSAWAGHAAVIGSAGDKYIGSAKNDTFVFQQSSDLTGATQIDGGTGTDALLLGGGSYAAAQFKGMKGIDFIGFTDANLGADFSVTLDNGLFQHSDSNLVQVLFTKSFTGHATVDASGVTDPTAGLTVLQFYGISDYKGGAGNDAFYFGVDNSGNPYLDSKDSVAGGAGTDTIALISSYNGTVILDNPDISNVSGIEKLVLSGNSNTHYSLSMTGQFEAEGIIDVNALACSGATNLDASVYLHDVTLHASQASGDTLYTGNGNDTIIFENTGAGAIAATLTAGDTVDGGKGTDTLVFRGDATVADTDFANVAHVERIALEAGSFNITLGADTDLAGIIEVDAGKANAAVTINGIASAKNLTLTGSNQADVLAGGSGVDHIAGGNGGDFLFGKGGNDVFVVHNAADSRQLAGNDLTHADTIEDWNTGDVIDIGALAQGAISVFNHGTVVNFISGDTANYFGANDVAAATDGNMTRVYIDANHDGNFTLNQDVMIQLVGNHINDVGNAAGYV